MAEEGKKILGIHLGLLLAEVICASAFYVELHRALGGNTLSWAYVVEWPVLGVYGAHVWRRLLAERRGFPTRELPIDQGEDSSLEEYNAYLARLHSTPSKSGQPPTSSDGDSSSRP